MSILCILQVNTKMKFLLSFAAVIAVAVAVPAHRGLVPVGPAGPVPAPELVPVGPAGPVPAPEAPEVFEPIAIGPAIIDSFQPIAIGPAVIDSFEPIAIGPAIIDADSHPISVGPAIIDFPLPDAGVVAEEPVVPGPAIVAPAPVAEVASGTPLVQIILNINQASAEASPIAVGPAVAPEAIVPEPVHVVDVAPEPVHVVEVAPEPVQVVEAAPVPVEPVVIGVPILPEAVVALPEALN
ncbi:uncharacterized protein KIAA0754-like [Spodoptera litura]|uniref:Uncharacterized protein KIAA0754-like n=1 Tax=Spodoptera litura TaxID=69820 RepID=A0A9J7IJA8_SPOLT|nr:uncharacterized protein KIAA0754-like [Spodoptera litura]